MEGTDLRMGEGRSRAKSDLFGVIWLWWSLPIINQHFRLPEEEKKQKDVQHIQEQVNNVSTLLPCT
jgi:hypothetical protein